MPATADTYTNNAVSTILGGAGGAGTPLNSGDTTLLTQVADAGKYSATGPFMLLIGSLSGAYELVKCTARASNSLTIVRAQEGTTAQNWATGNSVEQIISAGNMADIVTPLTNLVKGVYNVLDYNAKGDGVTDDGPSFRSAADAARVAGGGIVYAPGGRTYLIASTVTHPVTGGGQQVGLIMGSNTKLRGDGPGSTIIKFGSVANQAWLISNYQTVSAYSDKNISFEDFTLDGSAGSQNAGVVDAQFGIYLIGVYGLTHSNVEVIHVFGTTSGGNGPHGTPGEGMGFDLNGCDHVTYDHCRAWSDKTLPTATGFSANRCNDVMYTNCWAYGWKASMGFTHWTCWSIRYVNCWSTNNGTDGFHSEVSDGVTYVNCQSGGTTVPAISALYGVSTNLGSGQMGFHIFQCARALLVNCIAQRNTLNGLYVIAATGAVGSIRVVGGSFTTNSAYGIRMQDAASAAALEIKGRPETSGNTSGEVFANGVVIGLRNVITSPTVPASTVAYTNAYGVDMMVYIFAGTVTVIAVDGVTIATATSATLPVTVLVRQGGTITITYTVAPTWKWEAAG